ncbi:alkylglycerol monooxygenase [Centropristis striata]|uniref:alkylglycerol monooxygenase n=1 Tax=Centropristis striata TaxID=184440 RepID=UPI0027E15CAC|nr:alkylglycerol monooxygenase [Centropristis striata]
MTPLKPYGGVTVKVNGDSKRASCSFKRPSCPVREVSSSAVSVSQLTDLLNLQENNKVVKRRLEEFDSTKERPLFLGAAVNTCTGNTDSSGAARFGLQMAEAVDLGSVVSGVRSMFFMLTPNETAFQKVEEVPQYVQQATPYFVGLMVLELLVGILKTGAPVVTISDGLTSISAGMISRIPLLFMRGCELTAYMYVWNQYRLLELPWDSAWTWWFTFLGVDLGYYWVHRLAHEVNFIWAAHQVHHSSEYYNLTTALRQSLTQQFTSWIFYLPLALVAPPTVFAVHIQLNLLYQFWIHTELIRDLGPLEWVFNTPKHHRVHHGRNEYCIDKNYGGILIIWDRLFGTFASEGDKPIFGLVVPINTFDIVHVQLHYYWYLWTRAKTYDNIGDKLSTFIKGPSWKPGKSWLGDHKDNPEVTGQEVPHDPSWSLPLQVYVVMHFLLALGTYHDLFENKMMLSQFTMLGMTGYVLLTLTSLGYMIDQRPSAPLLETLRCVIMVALQRYGCMKPLLPSLAVPTEAFVSLSLLYWVLQSFTLLLRIKKKAD